MLDASKENTVNKISVRRSTSPGGWKRGDDALMHATNSTRNSQSGTRLSIPASRCLTETVTHVPWKDGFVCMPLMRD